MPDDDKNKNQCNQDDHQQFEERKALLIVLEHSHGITHLITILRIGAVGLSSQHLAAKLVQ